MQELYRTKKEKFTFFLIALYVACVFMFDADESKIRLTYFAYGLLSINLISRCKKVKIYRASLFLIAYCLYGITSIVWAEDPSEAYIRSRSVFILLVLYMLMTTYCVSNNNTLPLIASIMIGGLALSGYMIVSYGFSGIIQAMQLNDTRLGSSINNVNAVGNALSVGIVALLGVAINYRKKLLLVLVAPALITLLSTGSRTAVISMAVGGLVLLLCRLRSTGNPSNRIIQLITALMIILVFWVVIKSFPATQELALRIENIFRVFTGGQTVIRETSAQTRMNYIELGWKQFLESPIWGNGMGCAGYSLKESFGYVTYLHNNYIEILASGGLIGFILFYTPYVLFFNNLRRRIFIYNEKNPALFISFALLITKLLAHMGTVVYYSKIEYVLLALWTAMLYSYENSKEANP